MGLTMQLLKPSQYGKVEMGYRGFGELREMICGVANVNFIKYIGAESTGDAFYELRNHSDCDGQLSSYECEELLKDFEEYEDAFKVKYPESYEDYCNLMELIRECVDEYGIIEFR
jgi:hypothetical protein